MKAFNNSRTVPFNIVPLSTYLGFPCCSVVKNLPDKEGDAGDSGSIPGLGKSPGGGYGNPLQYSCLEKNGVTQTQSMGSHRVRHDWATKSTHTSTYLRSHIAPLNNMPAQLL